MIVVTDDTTADDLALTLTLLCTDAKAMSRRGKVGTLTAEYDRQHERINAVLDDRGRARG